MPPWYVVANTHQLLSPALLFYPDRIQENIAQMIAIAGHPDRLRPHVKTYKCSQIIRLQLEAGIQRFKCATLQEAELLAQAGGKDVLIAYPLIGPAQAKFLELVQQYPTTRFSCLVDHPLQIEQWNARQTEKLEVFIDIDLGMQRTGVPPEGIAEILEALSTTDYILRGWHVYDGHIHNTNLDERKLAVENAFQPLLDELESLRIVADTELVCGGSISFPIHARYAERMLSPGTTLLWDQGYGQLYPDLPFKIAAVVVTRVISKPAANKVCLDLGYKAIASEMKGLPIYFPELPSIRITNWSEEHLVLESVEAGNFEVGDLLYGFPWHICPTVALHEQAWIVKDQQIVDHWPITARNRIYQ